MPRPRRWRSRKRVDVAGGRGRHASLRPPETDGGFCKPACRGIGARPPAAPHQQDRRHPTDRGNVDRDLSTPTWKAPVRDRPTARGNRIPLSWRCRPGSHRPSQPSCLPASGSRFQQSAWRRTSKARPKCEPHRTSWRNSIPFPRPGWCPPCTTGSGSTLPPLHGRGLKLLHIPGGRAGKRPVPRRIAKRHRDRMVAGIRAMARGAPCPRPSPSDPVCAGAADPDRPRGSKSAPRAGTKEPMALGARS